MRRRGRLAVLLLIAGLSAGCDQATKKMAAAHLKPAPPQAFLGDTFRLHYAENPGAFLSAGAGLPEEARWWLMVGGIGLVLLGILAFTSLHAGLRPLTVAGLGFILGGGAGNWLDRLLLGNVVIDFMNVGVGPLRSGIFNFADLYIEVGLVLLALSYLRREQPGKFHGPATNADSRG